MKKLLWLLIVPAVLMAGAGCAAAETSTSADTAEIVFFKAGKADAAVIMYEDSVIMIDTGLEKNADDLVEALEELGVEKIDVLIITHFDKDHVGGAAEILTTFPVGTVYQSNSPKDSDEYEDYLEALEMTGTDAVTVSDTVSVSWGALSVMIDGPDQEEYPVDPSNNSSLVTTVSLGGTSVLFAGDAEDLRLEEFLEDYERPEGSVILKMPYHGHMQEQLSAFLDAVSPDAAVICCSKSEPDEEEREETEALLEEMGTETYLTFEGDVRLVLREDGYSIEQD